MNVAVRPASLDILSLCTGGGGLDLGIELAVPGARTVCMVEREAFAVAHLVAAMQSGLMAPCPVWSDARTFDGRRWRGCVDGLIGGIPCQPHSLAGRKRGSRDERDLWSPTRRIVVQARPWFVLIENVGGMLSPGDDEVAGAERVWRDLQKLGFAVEAGLFTAAEVGASHERERIFILGVADRDDAGLEGYGRPVERSGERLARESDGELADAESRRRDMRSAAHGRDRPEGATGGRGGALVDAALDRRREGRAEPSVRGGRDTAAGTSESVGNAEGGNGAGAGKPEAHHGSAWERQSRGSVGLFPPGPADLDGWRSFLAHSPNLEPAVRRMADGVAARVDLSGPHAARIERLRMLGNGVVSLEGAHAFRTLATRLAGRGSAGAARLVEMMS